MCKEPEAKASGSLRFALCRAPSVVGEILRGLGHSSGLSPAVLTTLEGIHTTRPLLGVEIVTNIEFALTLSEVHDMITVLFVPPP
jgi:hypothetical protein